MAKDASYAPFWTALSIAYRRIAAVGGGELESRGIVVKAATPRPASEGAGEKAWSALRMVALHRRTGSGILLPSALLSRRISAMMIDRKTKEDPS